MKKLFTFILLLAFCLTFSTHAQFNQNPKPTDLGGAMLKEKYSKAYQKVMTTNDSLRENQSEILKRWTEIKKQGRDADPDDVKEVFEMERDFNKKLREAMIKEDPALSSYFAYLDEQKAKRAKNLPKRSL